jgi:hypothetical protein
VKLMPMSLVERWVRMFNCRALGNVAYFFSELTRILSCFYMSNLEKGTA